VPASNALSAFTGAPALNPDRFRSDVDAALDQDASPRCSKQQLRPAEVVYGELDRLADLAKQLGVQVPERLSDHDAGWSSDDLP